MVNMAQASMDKNEKAVPKIPGLYSRATGDDADCESLFGCITSKSEVISKIPGD